MAFIFEAFLVLLVDLPMSRAKEDVRLDVS
jgi:hypothetical protein